jgi:SAM-dependent methyltransferase
MTIQIPRIVLHLFRDKRKRHVLDDQDVRVSIDMDIAINKPEFVQVVRDIQSLMLEKMVAKLNKTNSKVKFIELGAGVIPMSSWIKDVSSTDVVESEHLDGVLDATQLDLKDNSINGLFLQNTFHHIPDPSAFFSEALRVLIPGGRIIIVDPNHNLFSRVLYKNLFVTECFEINGSWNDASSHAMIGANQALSHIVFVRDRKKFERENPRLRIIETVTVRCGLRYLLTGGLNFRRIAPKGAFPLLSKLEKRLSILHLFAIHWLIVLEKQA